MPGWNVDVWRDRPWLKRWKVANVRVSVPDKWAADLAQGLVTGDYEQVYLVIAVPKPKNLKEEERGRKAK